MTQALRVPRLLAAAFGAIALLAGALLPAQAHQAIDQKILRMVKNAPAGTPSCYVNGEPTAACIEKGRKLFETGTFGGNGRTCASCHPASNNFTIDLPYIRKLPASDKLFVNEQVPALAELETPLLRKYGLICENLDGFPNEAGKRSCVMRSVIVTEGLAASTTPDAGPFDDTPPADSKPARPLFPLQGELGWAGDGAPGTGTLRQFAIGAVVQHFPRTLHRIPGTDFVLPTEDQLDAMEAFQLSLGRKADLNLNPDPLAQNKSFNCEAYDGSNANACGSSPVFELKTLEQLEGWRQGFSGTLITFTDKAVSNGQLLFFGGIPSKPDANTGLATNIRTCSGCHIQAGAGSPSAINTPASNARPAGNRQRATGASMSPESPVCKPEAQGVIFNADGGFGAGEAGFPSAQQDCSSSFVSAFPVIKGGCYKQFTASTEPPLSNPAIATDQALADVGKRNLVGRRDICGNAVADDQIYFTGTGFFSTPSLIEAASSIPLFHNNIAATVEDSVLFYATDAFNDSASGNKNRMVLDDVEDGDGQTVDIVHDVGAFLRAVNALNNLKISIDYIDAAIVALQVPSNSEKVRNAKLAVLRASDAVDVLTVGGPATQNYLGGPGNLFTSAPAVVSSLQAARNKLTLYGATESGYGKLGMGQLKAAHNQIVAACLAMLTAGAASNCPAALP